MREITQQQLDADAAAHLAMPQLKVNNLYATIQGEGALSGVPMIVLRLHGCPVGCPFCDTKHTWGEHDIAEGVSSYTNGNFISDPMSKDWHGENARWTLVRPGDLVGLVIHENHWLGGKIKWVMLTGGEPAMQPLTTLVNALHANRFSVNLETSGTALGHVGAGCDWVCVSPKIDMPGGRKIEPAAVMEADEIKFVIGKQSDIEKMDAFYAEFGGYLKATIRKSLQPMSANVKATQLCVETAIRRGWAVSIQTHKLLGIE